MIKTKISALFLGFLLFSAGCEQTPEDGGAMWVHKDYLVDGYLSIDQFKIKGGSGVYWLSAEGTKISKTTQDPEEIAEFNRLSALHGGWLGRKVWFSEGLYRPEIVCYDEEIATIDVTCNVAWDDAYPAGRSLKDFCQIDALSVAPFVCSPDTRAVLSQVYQRLSWLKEGDLEMLIDGGIQLRVLHSDNTPSKRVLTFQIQMESGRIFTASIAD